MNNNVISLTPPLKADREMAAEFGVTANTMRSMRDEHLIEGCHWKRKTGRNSIEFTEEGVKALQMAMGLTIQVKEPKVDATEFTLLRVVRACRNPLYITVANTEGIAIDLRVKSNRNVRPRMLIQCGMVDGAWRVTQRGLAPR